MPTAVMTASRENTASSTTICDITTRSCVGPLRAAVVRIALETLVQLHRGLDTRNSPPTTGSGRVREAEAINGEQRRRERDHPGDGGQQPESHQQRQRQADLSRPVPLMGGSLSARIAMNTRYDAQHDLQDDQRQQPIQMDGSSGIP